jgi:AraC-like DNA-binding protein
MRPFFETVTPEAGESWAFLDRRLPDGIPFEWHQHPEFELTLTLNSRGHRYVGDDVEPYDDGDVEPYDDGDLVLIGPGIPHSWHSREAVDATRPHVALVAWFTREWAARLTTLFPETARIDGMLARAAQGLSFGQAARGEVGPLIKAMRMAASPRRLVLLLDVLTTLCQDPDTVSLANIPTEPIKLAADPRIARVLAHLHTHFAEPVSIGRMAELACVSTSAFHRIFKRHTRMTMVGYTNRLRIGRACSMLIESAMPIATIAADVGFTNLSLFNRQFAHAKGDTPRNFRKRHRSMLAVLA